MLLKEKALPLPDHPQISIVHDKYLDWKPVFPDRCQFLKRHLETAVPDKQQDLGTGPAEGRSHGGRQAEAHSPKSAGGQKSPAAADGIVLGHKHLMLAHIGHHHRIRVRHPGHRLYDSLGFEQRSAEFCWLLVFLLPLMDAADPLGVRLAFDQRGIFQQDFEEFVQIPMDRKVRDHIFL